jgi:hypothetical protein
MKSRYINTKFWSDPFVSELEPKEKLLFLYFLTNQHTNISGIYEISMKIASFETGLDEEWIIETLNNKFDNKILYHNGYIIVKNFYRHQQKNARINIGIASQLQELPPKVISKLHEIRFPVKELMSRGKEEKNAFQARLKNRRSESNGFSKAFGD